MLGFVGHEVSDWSTAFVVDHRRPNPDSLLKRVERDEERAQRGKLRIFFGYAAGVGKTYAMLAAAQREKAAGVDVVVGYVEAHGRPETEQLLQGLAAIPPKEVIYRSVTLREFDLDAALARHPQLLMVDELAHTNAEGLRHTKRWQDVTELLDAGIDVWTTLNVQHLESLNDVIAQITGTAVRETLPDAILEQADEIELIDITPQELHDRLKAGKVYVLRKIDDALRGFFRPGNLAALRELSLRQAATRLHRDVENARRDQSALAPWATTDRLLVCVGPSPSSARLIRAAKRTAVSLGAEWIAVAVDGGKTGADGETLEQTSRNLRLAASLGAETHLLIGDNVSATVLAFAREHNVSKIVIGRTAESWWRRLFGSIVDQLLNDAEGIDVYVVASDKEDALPPAVSAASPPVRWRDYLVAAAVVVACTLFGWGAHTLNLAEANIVMLFLAGVAVISTWLGRGPAIAAAVASVLVFDFCFVKPFFTFAVSDYEYAITLGVMLGIGMVISGLSSRQRSQLQATQRQERRLRHLFRMTRQLSELSGTDFLVSAAGRQLNEIFGGQAVLYLRERDGTIALRFGESTEISKQAINYEVARWVASNGKLAGAGTDTLPNATALFVPLIGSQGTVGALGVQSLEPTRFDDPEQVRLLETCASLVALSLERDRSVLDASEAQLKAETEMLRNSLLSAVSHDIRTPLTTIAGASSTLIASHDALPSDTRNDLLASINDEAENLSRLVENLLHMTRLTSGKVVIDRQWYPIDEIIGSMLTRMDRQLVGRKVDTQIDGQLPLVLVNAVLIEQLLINLVDNAVKYSPAESAISIVARPVRDGVELEVSDQGRGFVDGDENRVFDLFYRGSDVRSDRRGVGIGLAICRAIAEVHGGRMTARNRSAGGAAVSLFLPCEAPPPVMAESSQEEASL